MPENYAPTNLLEQIGDTELAAVAVLCGLDVPTPTFRTALSGIPLLPEDYSLADVARAYLGAKLAELPPEPPKAGGGRRRKKIRPMNILLRDLMREGVMTDLCTAFSDPHRREHILRMKAGRTIMDMGDDVAPGPYWAVADADVPKLVAAGYRVNMRPKTTG